MTAQRTPEQEVFYNRIRQHLSNLCKNSQFADRLARENKWSPAFTKAIVEEYAKFLFIAREGGHSVSPSPKIDKAWHLHLLYTKEYWSDFCPNILGFKLDHSPHTGNSSDSEKFDEWTDQTLKSYRKFFGMPNRIWLPARPAPNPLLIFFGILIGGAGILGLTYATNASTGESAVLMLIVIIAVGFVLLLKAFAATGVFRTDTSKSGCSSFSSCGSGDASSFTGHGGSGGHGHGCGGGHGGGHVCGGGHGCGGSGCGGAGGH